MLPRPARRLAPGAIAVDERLQGNLAEHPELDGERWVRQLPDQVASLAARWRLNLTAEQLHGGSWGVLLCCRTASGHEAVLKLCASPQRLASEHAALSAFGAGAAVAVLAYEPGALLLARARPGAPCASLSAAQLAGLLVKLARPAPVGLAPVAEQIRHLRACAGRAPAGLGGTAERIEALADELLARTRCASPVTLHGDLHTFNIISRGTEPVVIDPLGFAGEPELDLAGCAVHADFTRSPEQRVRTLAALTGTDCELALALGRLVSFQSALFSLRRGVGERERIAEHLRFAAGA